MEVQSLAPDQVRKILGGKGKKLHTHEIHVRRTENKGYIARHDLRDRHGNHPSDGQRSEKEYALPDKAALLAHMEQHMGEPADAAEPGDEGPEEQQSAPNAAIGGQA